MQISKETRLTEIEALKSLKLVRCRNGIDPDRSVDTYNVTALNALSPSINDDSNHSSPLPTPRRSFELELDISGSPSRISKITQAADPDVCNPAKDAIHLQKTSSESRTKPVENLNCAPNTFDNPKIGSRLSRQPLNMDQSAQKVEANHSVKNYRALRVHGDESLSALKHTVNESPPQAAAHASGVNPNARNNPNYSHTLDVPIQNERARGLLLNGSNIGSDQRASEQPSRHTVVSEDGLLNSPRNASDLFGAPVLYRTKGGPVGEHPDVSSRAAGQNEKAHLHAAATPSLIRPNDADGTLPVKKPSPDLSLTEPGIDLLLDRSRGPRPRLLRPPADRPMMPRSFAERIDSVERFLRDRVPGAAAFTASGGGGSDGRAGPRPLRGAALSQRAESIMARILRRGLGGPDGGAAETPGPARGM